MVTASLSSLRASQTDRGRVLLRGLTLSCHEAKPPLFLSDPSPAAVSLYRASRGQGSPPEACAGPVAVAPALSSLVSPSCVTHVTQPCWPWATPAASLQRPISTKVGLTPGSWG